MSGNVSEWCFDDFDGAGDYRVFRGGGLVDGAGSCAVGSQMGSIPVLGYDDMGFRLVLSLAP